MHVQDLAEQRLERLCQRAGVSLRGLDDRQIDAALRLAIEHGSATASDWQALRLLRACVHARFVGLDDSTHDELLLAYRGLDDDLVEHGRVMSRGRKVGAIGKVRKFLRTYMAKHRDASTADAWAAIKARPPKGCEVYERPMKYIFTSGAKQTSYRQFANLVSLERPK